MISEASPMFPVNISENDNIILRGGETFRLTQVKKDSTLKLGRSGQINIGSLIGQRFGDVFEIDEKRKILVPSADNPDLDRSAIDVQQVAEEGKDNRSLDDTHGVAQALSHQDVEELKQNEGVKNIVGKLVESSATFETKTSFAQEKYVRRKKAKYAVLYSVERVTVENLSELQVRTYAPDAMQQDDHNSFCTKHLAVRIDTIAQILHYASISADSRVLLHEWTNGVLSAGIMNRLGPNGRIFNALPVKGHPPMAYAKMMQLREVKERWFCVHLKELLEEPTTTATVPSSSSLEEGKKTPELKEKINSLGKSPSSHTNTSVTAANNNNSTTATCPTGNQWLSPSQVHSLFHADPPHCVIIASDATDMVTVALGLFRFLALSGKIVVYSPTIEPLFQLWRKLHRQCVQLHIWDTWYREYQVLPGRTHPTVTMSGNGGFLFYGVKIDETSRRGYYSGTCGSSSSLSGQATTHTTDEPVKGATEEGKPPQEGKTTTASEEVEEGESEPDAKRKRVEKSGE